jgi:xanthine dehydrogenase accessory factor
MRKMDTADIAVLKQAHSWVEAGHGAALVTVAKTWGSSPRPPGSVMAIRSDGQVAGSVSGGCIEDDLIASVHAGGLDKVFDSRAAFSVQYGIDTETAHRFGLPCGGTLELVIERVRSATRLGELLQALGGRGLVRRELDLGTGRVELCAAERAEMVSFDGKRLSMVFGPRYRLLVIGAGQLSAYLCDAARGLGFDITVCDPREEYTTSWDVQGVRLVHDMPDDVVAAMRPDSSTAVIALTHDPKLDDLALMEALRSPAFYVAAIGSRSNNEKRRERFVQHFDMSREEAGRLHGPAGLYIGSKTPPEIALSILAELVATKNGVGRSLAGAQVGRAKDVVEAGRVNERREFRERRRYLE